MAKASISNLLNTARPEQWKDFLFNLQSTMIDVGYIESLTKTGREEFTDLTSALYNFFDELCQVKKQP